jgi:hypothetical protein
MIPSQLTPCRPVHKYTELNAVHSADPRVAAVCVPDTDRPVRRGVGCHLERKVAEHIGGSRSLPAATPRSRVDGFQAVAGLAAADGQTR